MATLTITLTNQPRNYSVQTGDFLYSIPTTTPTTVYPWRVQNGVTNPLGIVTNITQVDPLNHIIECEVDPAVVILPQFGDYLTFQKDNAINTSSVKGYYAKIVFSNDSRERAELFSVGSNISISS